MYRQYLTAIPVLLDQVRYDCMHRLCLQHDCGIAKRGARIAPKLHCSLGQYLVGRLLYSQADQKQLTARYYHHNQQWYTITTSSSTSSIYRVDPPGPWAIYVTRAYYTLTQGPYTNQIVTTTPTHNTILQDVKPDGTDATSIKIIILVCTMTVTLLIPKITQTLREMPTSIQGFCRCALPRAAPSSGLDDCGGQYERSAWISSMMQSCTIAPPIYRYLYVLIACSAIGM